VMLEYLPTLAAAGVPLSCPLVVLNVAHAGLFAIENVSLSPSASDAVGRKLYAAPTSTVVAGDPPIVGARFGLDTTIENAGSDVVALPSLTLMTIEANVPAAV